MPMEWRCHQTRALCSLWRPGRCGCCASGSGAPRQAQWNGLCRTSRATRTGYRVPAMGTSGSRWRPPHSSWFSLRCLTSGPGGPLLGCQSCTLQNQRSTAWSLRWIRMGSPCTPCRIRAGRSSPWSPASQSTTGSCTSGTSRTHLLGSWTCLRLSSLATTPASDKALLLLLTETLHHRAPASQVSCHSVSNNVTCVGRWNVSSRWHACLFI
mmetsp:Transcript_13743/g.38909  ORF Transcript_13743/g.38909 Transcript_13743/m.38909 type:complete len:211 (+) Transcript_13743:446-1078(+)